MKNHNWQQRKQTTADLLETLQGDSDVLDALEALYGIERSSAERYVKVVKWADS